MAFVPVPAVAELVCVECGDDLAMEGYDTCSGCARRVTVSHLVRHVPLGLVLRLVRLARGELRELPPPDDLYPSYPIDLGAGVRGCVTEGTAVLHVRLWFPSIGHVAMTFDKVTKHGHGWSLLSTDPLWFEPSLAVKVGPTRIHGFVRNGRWSDVGDASPGGTREVRA